MQSEKMTMKRVTRFCRCAMYSLIALIGLFAYHKSTAQVLNIEEPSTPLDSLRKNDFRWGLSVSGNVSKQSLLMYEVGLVSECVCTTATIDTSFCSTRSISRVEPAKGCSSTVAITMCVIPIGFTTTLPLSSSCNNRWMKVGDYANEICWG